MKIFYGIKMENFIVCSR